MDHCLLLSLANAVSKSGTIPGVILLTLSVFFSGFTGIQLSQNWIIMRNKWVQYRNGYCRRPYSEMAFRAFGPKGRFVVDIILAVTLFGSVVALMEFVGQHAPLLMADLFHWRLSFCFTILLLGLLLWPFSMLRSPMHFWQGALISAVTSAMAAVGAIGGTAHDAPVCYKVATYNKFNWKNLFLGYATVVFACGGHSAFPTIQNDMLRPQDFSKSIILSYTIILVVYLSVSVLGYQVYGDSLDETLIPSIQVKWLSTTVNALITTHVIPATLIFFCPLVQQVEEWTNCPHGFGIYRLLVRTAVLLLSLFTALSLANFGVIMDLVGGSSISLITMVLPSVFWLFLTISAKMSNLEEKANIQEVIQSSRPLCLALNCASLALFLRDASSLLPPMVPFHPLPFYPSPSVHCCGHFRNITVSGISPEGFCV